MRTLKLLIILILSSGIYAQNDAVFDRANALYNEAKYAEAIDLYESILQTENHSAELYYNLGNAHYKLNNIAPSIFYFEKALQLSPNDSEIKNNLAFAQNMTIDAIETVPEVGFSKLFKNTINAASADTWALIAVTGVFVFVLLFLLYRFAYATARKRVAFIISVTGLLIAAIALILAFQKERLDQNDNPAIVFAQESRVKTDPNKASEELFRIHEGTKIQILESYEDWFKIELADNSVGWIPASDVKPLNEFAL